MEITSGNFKEKLPEIQEAIDTASFLAIDGEFTGLNAYRGISHFDLPAERYDKLQESARSELLTITLKFSQLYFLGNFFLFSLVFVLSIMSHPLTATPTRPLTSTCGPGLAAGVHLTQDFSVRLQA